MSKKPNSAEPRLEMIPVAKCRLLERNPQTVSPKQMAALKKSIKKNGMLAPILVRVKGDFYEIISGNHRFIACQELGYEMIPAVIADISDERAKVLAVNLNLIHGEPTPEQLAPFLGDMSDKLLREIHLDGDLLKKTLEFDKILADRLKSFASVPGLDSKSTLGGLGSCVCPKCGRSHMRQASASVEMPPTTSPDATPSLAESTQPG